MVSEEPDTCLLHLADTAVGKNASMKGIQWYFIMCTNRTQNIVVKVHVQWDEGRVRQAIVHQIKKKKHHKKEIKRLENAPAAVSP